MVGGDNAIEDVRRFSLFGYEFNDDRDRGDLVEKNVISSLFIGYAGYRYAD